MNLCKLILMLIIPAAIMPVFATYHTQQELQLVLDRLSKNKPKMIKLLEIGKGHQGRPILLARLTLLPEESKNHPKILLVAGTHGDEIIGREVVFELVNYFAGLKSSHPHLEILRHAELFIVPCHNPDGCDLMRRTDALGRDLNRYFPYVDEALKDLPSGVVQDWNIESYPLENQAIMRLFQEHRFQIGLTYHAGEIPTVNYPWDFANGSYPFLETAKELANQYAQLNPIMRMNLQFAGGVANGYHWYSIVGGLQDWALAYHDCLMLTPELTLLERPPWHERNSHVADNLAASIGFLRTIMHGAGFKVADGLAEFEHGEVLIYQMLADEKRLVKKVQFSNSFYYTILSQGEYEMTINGHQGKSRSLQFSMPGFNRLTTPRINVIREN